MKSGRRDLQFNFSNEEQKLAYEFLGKLGRSQASFVSSLISNCLRMFNINDVSNLSNSDAKALASTIPLSLSGQKFHPSFNPYGTAFGSVDYNSLMFMAASMNSQLPAFAQAQVPNNQNTGFANSAPTNSPSENTVATGAPTNVDEASNKELVLDEHKMVHGEPKHDLDNLNKKEEEDDDVDYLDDDGEYYDEDLLLASNIFHGK